MKKLLSILGISLFLFSACSFTPQQEEEEDTPVVVVPPAEDAWLTYSNPAYGVSFQYPPSFEITEDVRYDYGDGMKWFRIDLIDNSNLELVKMIFEVDLDGYGPFFPDTRYELEETEEGKIIITDEITPNPGADPEEYASYTENYTHIMTSLIEAKNGHIYNWQFTFEEGEVDYEPLFQEILSTFTLY